MEQRITENMGRSLKEHGYRDPVFVGKGSFAKVYRVRDEKRDFQACKISKVTEQWEQECRNSREICHPLFPAYREHWTDGEWGYLVMEFWDGCDLRKMLDMRGRLSPGQAARIALQITEGLQYLHERPHPFLYRDLKPENIMLDRSGNIYLIDFGAALFAGEKLSGYGTKNYASKKQAKTEERADIYFDIYSLGKTMESLLKATDAVQKIIEKCLIDDDAKRYHNIRQIQADFERILRICRMKKGFMVVIAVFCIQNLWNQIQREEQREKEVIVQKKSQREIKKAMAYFYGTDQIQKNTQLARVYLERCRGMKKNVSSYLVLLDVLDDRRNDISAEKLMKIVQDCQTDVHDFWSAYFYLHFYTVNTAKLSENVWKEAEKMLEQIQKYPQKEEYQKLVEADRINLYEREAEKGDDRKFLEETDRVFKENLRGDPAWKLYERKLVYLESKQPDISGEFERFLKKYPKVMDAYVEYSIYLCRNNKMTQAQRVYREGRKQTGMTSKRAEELRRKLGL